MDDGLVVHAHRRVSFPLQHRGHRGKSRRNQLAIVLLPDSFQLSGEQFPSSLVARLMRDTMVALWVDPRSVPFCGPRNWSWLCHGLWRASWDMRSIDRRAGVRRSEWGQCGTLSGWQWPLCVYACSAMPSDQGYGRCKVNIDQSISSFHAFELGLLVYF